MKQLVILSGKGGTGKTTVAASFAALANRPVLADADVDSSNLPLVLSPTVEREEPFYGSQVAAREEEQCVHCGACVEVCRFDAIGEGPTFREIHCEGCAVCTLVCPSEAITMETRLSGTLYRSRTRYGPLSHACLGPGAEGSGKLVTAVRTQAEEMATAAAADLILIDGPPGIGCPVVAALSGVDAALIVTEPTLSGWHDLERVEQVARHFGVKTFLCVNRCDLSAENTAALRRFGEEAHIPILGEIPVDPAVPAALVAGCPVVEFGTSPAARALRKLWARVQERL
jgi:MinD superfamily P-loop ATPase